MIVVLTIVLLVLVEGDFLFCAGICSSFLLAGLSITRKYIRLTDKGKKLDAKIRGLEMYIRTAEKERLAKINAPEDTVEKYEEILPYAVALDCADAWQKRFEPLLNHIDYVPEWIEDDDIVQHGFNFVRYSTVIKTMAAPSVMTQSIDSAAKAYAKATSGYAGSSSSGSSGFSGGSSGGGSGGGGGGW